MAKKERVQGQDMEATEAPLMQKPTITDAVTYIVDKDGNEIKAEAEPRKSVDE